MVYVTSTRSLLLEPQVEQAIMGDQKRLEVQPYARYRIVDPLALLSGAADARSRPTVQLDLLVSSAARRALGQAPLRALLTEERGQILDAIKTEVAAKAAPLGVSVDEVRFRRADLPFETSQAIYDRMKSERQREAKELRAQGYEWAQQIQAKADHDRTVILSEAQRAAAVARGEGDAEANRALGEAFSQNPQFYAMVRSLQTYKGALANSEPDHDRQPRRRLHAAPEVGARGRAGRRSETLRPSATARRRAAGPMIDVAASLFLLLQIFFVDLLLGADNAIVIAMACRRLPPDDTRRAIVLGAGGAIALRLVMLLFANALLGVPLVKLVGAWMLIVIALNVRAQNGGRRRARAAGPRARAIFCPPPSSSCSPTRR